MRACFRLRTGQVAIGVTTLTGLALCLSPVAGVPSIESALVLGLVAPPLSALWAARGMSAYVRHPCPPSMGSAIGHLSLATATLWLIPLAILTLHLFFAPVCDPWSGLAFIVLGPGLGVLFASACGCFLGLLDRYPSGWRKTLIAVVACSLPVIGLGTRVLQFYGTPAIFSYGHFFGYFPGALYDPDISIHNAYLSFRALTLVAIAGLWALSYCLTERGLAYGGARAALRQPYAMMLVAFAALASIAGAVWADELGHSTSASYIERALGRRVETPRCIAILPRETPDQEAQRIGRDCSFRVRQVEQTLGVKQPVRLRAFFFRSAEEKRALMGAARTEIAKPWRREVYVRMSQWPHPVLFHEVAHVVAGNVGRGPFRIAATWGGLIPAPAIIEGVAVAVAWEARQGLTPHQWARAMLELDKAPRLASVFGFGFLLQPASRAYITAGSFVRWMMESKGSAAVRTLYQSGDWERALGQPLNRAEAAWRRYLREEVPLPPEALALAARRFERPGLFAQVCPHRVAHLSERLRGDLGAGDDDAAVRTCQTLLGIDPGLASVRSRLVGVLARSGRLEQAEAELARLAGPPAAAQPLVHAAQQAFADALWTQGRRSDAERIYRELMHAPLSDDVARQVEIRLHAISSPAPRQRALRRFLVPSIGRRHDGAVAMSHVSELARASAEGADDLARYLMARQLVLRQRFDLALPQLKRIDAAKLPSPRFRREAERLLAVSRTAVGPLAEARAAWRAVLQAPRRSAAERLQARDWLRRVRYEGRHRAATAARATPAAIRPSVRAEGRTQR